MHKRNGLNLPIIVAHVSLSLKSFDIQVDWTHRHANVAHSLSVIFEAICSMEHSMLDLKMLQACAFTLSVW
jgi:hypothetical protein